MKARSGFVSNSSSSSFIVAYRSNFADDYKAVVVTPTEGTPFAFITTEIGTCLKKNIDETYKSLREYFEREDADPDYNNNTIISLLEQGYIVSEGSIADDNYDEIDAYLAHKAINFESERLVIHTDGGY